VSIGVTDTDDALDEVQAKRDMVIIFPDKDAPAKDRMGTLFIPTRSRSQGLPQPGRGAQTGRFSPERRRGAPARRGPSGQIPLNADVKAKLPAQLEIARTAKAMELIGARPRNFGTKRRSSSRRSSLALIV